MAYAKGTDAAGGGSTVNQAYINRIAEEKWAAEQEEKRKREDAEARHREREQAAQEAREQAQKEAEMRERNAAAAKAAQERAKAEAYQRAQQEAAARAAQERQRQAEEQAAQQRQEEERARQEAQQSGQMVLPKNYSKADSGKTAADLESEWFEPKTEAPEVTISEPAEENTVNDSWKEAPDSVADVEVSQPRMRTAARRSEEPIVYTGESSTGAGNKTVRRMAANTKAALTEEENGMSPEQLAWLQSAEGQAALANQQAKQANDATLRAAALNSGITFSGQPITADKTFSGQPMSPEEAARLAAVKSSLAAADAARNYREGSPGGQRYVYQPPAANTNNLPNPQVIDMNAPGYQPPAGTLGQQGTGSGTPTFGEVLQGMANNWLLSRNGNSNPGTDAVSNYRVGTPGEQRYDARYPRTTTAEQEAYVNNPNTGPAMTETPSFGEVISEMWKDRAPDRTGEAGDLSYTFTPPSTSYESDEETINPNIGRNSSGEWKAIQQEDKWIREGYAEAQKQPRWTERDRRAYAQFYADQKAKEQPASTEPTWQEQLAERRRRGEERAEANAPGGRPGAANAVDEILNSNLNTAEAARNYRDGTPGEQRYVYRPGAESTSGSTTGTSGSTTKAASGEARAEKQAPKGSVYFTTSYGQGGKGVKLPYSKDGYTAAEIEAVGNNARSDQKYYNGAKAYEGYYLAPNGKYYPIDQEKAAYYIANGNSYKGWEEPMRDYYKTFGTYYGYRPDWKTAGGLNQWKYNTSPSRSYSNYSSNKLSYTPASSGRSYGRGSTPNNGMWWNGLTSWNA